MSDGTQSLGMLGWQSGVAALALIVGIAGTALSARAQTLPTDAVPLCAVPSATFNGWFQSGSAALNGLVDQYKLHGRLIDDTALGAVMNSSADFNLAGSTRILPAH